MSKTVRVEREFDYQPPSDRRISIRFCAGFTYRRVIDAAASAIERAGAGRIVNIPDTEAAGLKTVDASHAFRPRIRR